MARIILSIVSALMPMALTAVEVNATGSGTVPILSSGSTIALPAAVNSQQQLLKLFAQTPSVDQLRIFLNRKSTVNDPTTADWYFGRTIDITNANQMVWGADSRGWNWRVGRGVPATSDLMVSGDGSVIIGADPGGPDTLRVGGSICSGVIFDALSPNSNLGAGFNPVVNADLPGSRSRAFRFLDRAYIDFELIQGGRGILHFGTDFGGRNNVLTLNTNTGSAVVGSDPGGLEKLRVGGTVGAKGYLSGGVYDSSAVNPSLPSGFNAAIAAAIPGQRSRPISFSDRAYIDFELIQGGRGILHFGTDFSGRNNVLSLNTNTGSAIIGNDPGGSGQLRVGGGADINGTIRTKEVIVTMTGWSDDVFAPDYHLPALADVAQHIEVNRHLPGIPSESEIVERGLSMGAMQRIHMAKIEELTLYAITADKRQAEVDRRLTISDECSQNMAVELGRARDENHELKNQNAQLEARLQAIERTLSITQSVAP